MDICSLKLVEEDEQAWLSRFPTDNIVTELLVDLDILEETKKIKILTEAYKSIYDEDKPIKTIPSSTIDDYSSNSNFLKKEMKLSLDEILIRCLKDAFERFSNIEIPSDWKNKSNGILNNMPKGANPSHWQTLMKTLNIIGRGSHIISQLNAEHGHILNWMGGNYRFFEISNSFRHILKNRLAIFSQGYEEPEGSTCCCGFDSCDYIHSKLNSYHYGLYLLQCSSIMGQFRTTLHGSINHRLTNLFKKCPNIIEVKEEVHYGTGGTDILNKTLSEAHRILKSKIIPKRWLRADGSITKLSDESNEDSPLETIFWDLGISTQGRKKSAMELRSLHNSIMNTNAVTTTDIIHAKIEKYSSEIIPDDKFNQKIFMLGIDNLGRLNDDETDYQKYCPRSNTPHKCFVRKPAEKWLKQMTNNNMKEIKLFKKDIGFIFYSTIGSIGDFYDNKIHQRRTTLNKYGFSSIREVMF